jgi:predicted permease
MNMFPDDVILQAVVMIQTAMPSAVNIVLACQIAGGGEEKISTILFWQYIICSVTISSFCIFVQWLLLK